MEMETVDELKRNWQVLRADKPKMRIRDAAAQLGVSEAGLVATGCGGPVVRLNPDWADLFDAFKTLGRVMSLTRNEWAVHERRGIFREVGFFHGGLMGQVVGPDIDLRLFPEQWAHVFAVREDAATGAHGSVQIFGGDGMAMLKVFLQPESDRGAFDALIAELRSDDQSPSLAILPVEPTKPEIPDAEVDVEGLRAGWKGLEDTHQFFGLLKRFHVSRTQALRLAGGEFAVPVQTNAAMSVLENASNGKLPIMIFVGNRGCIQIHTGEVIRIQPFADWINVLDPDFNLHLCKTGIDSAWLVRKPTTDGVVTSVELYDAAGENIALFFGRRKPGDPEDPNWRKLAESLAA